MPTPLGLRVEKRVIELFEAFLKKCEIELDDPELTFLSCNYNIPVKYVEDNPDKNWNYHLLYEHIGKDWDGGNARRLYNIRRIAGFVKSNPQMNPQMHTQIKWSRKVLDSIDIDWEGTRSDRDKINWHDFSQNRNLKWSDVVANPDLPWDYEVMTRNVFMTSAIFLANPGIGWNYNAMSGLKWLTLDILLAFKEKPWNYSIIFARTDIVAEIVKRGLSIRECVSASDFKEMNIKPPRLPSRSFVNRCYNEDSSCEVMLKMPILELARNPMVDEEFIRKNGDVNWPAIRDAETRKIDLPGILNLHGITEWSLTRNNLHLMHWRYTSMRERFLSVHKIDRILRFVGLNPDDAVKLMGSRWKSEIHRFYECNPKLIFMELRVMLHDAVKDEAGRKCCGYNVDVESIPVFDIKNYEDMVYQEPISIWLMYNPGVISHADFISLLNPTLRSLVLFNTNIFQWEKADKLEKMATFLGCTMMLNDLSKVIWEYYY